MAPERSCFFCDAAAFQAVRSDGAVVTQTLPSIFPVWGILDIRYLRRPTRHGRLAYGRLPWQGSPWDPRSISTSCSRASWALAGRRCCRRSRRCLRRMTSSRRTLGAPRCRSWSRRARTSSRSRCSRGGASTSPSCATTSGTGCSPALRRDPRAGGVALEALSHGREGRVARGRPGR